MTEPFCEDYIYLFETRSAACNYCVENNMLFPMFFLVSFIPFTILFSSWVVAKFVYLPHMKQVENDKDIEWPVEDNDEIPYEKKYKLDETLDDNKDITTKNCNVCESTPDGIVFMQYDKDNEGFNWWSDNKQTSYKYLETVARKYVKVFKCASLYVDREKDINQQIERENEEKEKENMKSEDKEDEVDSDDELFVKFKPKEQMKPKKKGEKAAINSNKYKYCGKIKDFKLLQIPKKKVNANKKMDFSSWKTMFTDK